MKKKISIIILIIAILAIVVHQVILHKQMQNLVTSEEFNERMDKVDADLDTIKTDTWHLKKGQKVIYDEVKKSNIPFWKKLFDNNEE